VINEENAAIQAGNTAPRASQISANLDPSLILSEGSKRKKRRRAYFTAKYNEEDPLERYFHAFSASLTDSIRVNNRQPPKANDDPTSLRIHRDTLPAEPKGWRNLARHPMGKQFIAAAYDEFNTQKKRGTFGRDRETGIPQTTASFMGLQIQI